MKQDTFFSIIISAVLLFCIVLGFYSSVSAYRMNSLYNFAVATKK